MFEDMRRHHAVECSIRIGDRPDIRLPKLGHNSGAALLGVCRGKHRARCVDAVVVRRVCGDASERLPRPIPQSRTQASGLVSASATPLANSGSRYAVSSRKRRDVRAQLLDT